MTTTTKTHQSDGTLSAVEKNAIDLTARALAAMNAAIEAWDEAGWRLEDRIETKDGARQFRVNTARAENRTRYRARA